MTEVQSKPLNTVVRCFNQKRFALELAGNTFHAYPYQREGRLCTLTLCSLKNCPKKRSKCPWVAGGVDLRVNFMVPLLVLLVFVVELCAVGEVSA